MNTLDYGLFSEVLKQNGSRLDETSFYFAGDPEQAERWLGYLPGAEKPYWIGGCDIPGGTEYDSAEELLTAPVFGGKSLKERWAQVRIDSAMGLALEEWCKFYLD